MKTTYRIAIAELRSLFCSPVAWLILVIFAVQVGVAFGNAFDRQVQGQALGYTLWDVTASNFTGWMGIFPGFLRNLYLYIPLLTMGLMSREYSSGSIKLLFSSPVTDSQIIFGKYLSVLIYNLVLILPLLVVGVFCGITITNADLGLLFTGILGIYLLICAYGAIGLFMSSITSYQVVAAMGTLAVLAALNYVGEVGQDYAFVRDVTYWLSISGRADEFINGLICSEDLLYFLLIIALFLTLSVLKLRAGRRKESRGKTWGTYGAVVLSALLVGYISTLPTLKLYHDSTATKRNTLTKTSQDIMKQIDGGLKITSYMNLLDDNYAIALPSQLKSDYERFEKYIRFKPDTKMEYVYYYDEANSQLDFRLEGCNTLEEKAQKMANILNLNINMFLTPEQIREVEHLVNAKIRENVPLTEYRNLPIEKAKELGAIALFGEKYGDEVRVVQFGSSIEFCGGTHVSATGKIGMVKIISESSVAAGVRRIEAVTGAKVEEMFDTVQDTINDLKALFNNAPDLKAAISKYIEENAGLKKQMEEFMKEKEAAVKNKLIEGAKEINGVKVIKAVLPMPADAVKNIAFQLKGQFTENLFVVIGSVFENKPLLTVTMSEDQVKAGLNAGQLVREAAKLIQGGGGGQPHFATAGGKNPDGLNAAVDKVVELAGF